MTSLAYLPPQPIMSRQDWPTLGDMISSGKRVVVFMDKGLEARKEADAEFMLPEFKMVWEDTYDPTDISFPCKVERTAGPLAPREQLNLINQNLNANLLPLVGERGFLVPDRLNSPRANSVDLWVFFFFLFLLHGLTLHFKLKSAQACGSLLEIY